MREPPPLIFRLVPGEEIAQRLAAALRRWGVAPFVTQHPWQGSQQLFVAYYARNAHEEHLLDDLLQEAGLEDQVAPQPAYQATADDERKHPQRLCAAFSTRNAQQARLLTELLHRAGIESLATDQLAASSAPPPQAVIQVLVRCADREKALCVVDQWRAQPPEGEEDPTGGAAAETLIAWPQCPACGTPRETCCPKCRTTGSQWQQADPRYLDPEAAGDEETADTDLVVICPTCDWMFAPRFYRRCPMCSHDFGSGIEAEARAVSEAEAINPRVIAVVLVLGILLLAVLAYFALLGPRN